MKQVCARIDKDLKKKLGREASNQKRTESSLIRKILSDSLETEVENHDQ